MLIILTYKLTNFLTCAMIINMNSFIKNLRTKYKYSQEDIAKTLGISRQTMAQIEKGESELTISQLKKLADLFDFPSIDDFLSEKKLPDIKNAKQNKKLEKPEIRISIPQNNLKKFKEILLYILEKVGAKPNVGEAVICKLLYFIDFDYYEKYEEQLIGAVYIKNHFGPTPANFKNIVIQMEKDGDLATVGKKYFRFPQKKYLPRRKADLQILSARDLEHIDWVLARLSDKNAKEMEEYSHRDVPWITADNMSPIDYEAVFYRTPEFSVREYEDDL